MMTKPALLGIAFACLAVVLGAFGAHALRTRLDASQLLVFETGVRYQFYHAFALVLVGLSAGRIDPSWGRVAVWLFAAGILLFSGSLYLLSTRSLIGTEGWKFLGPITPLGGLCFILGWISYFVSFVKK